ncbi:F-box/LRR-repeat protein At3g48880-like [Malus domestica]|uniref:F-box/LRR-repeat protein At3g48880-like n=1 Tax=Malus domestica TaxID=3750 RepID=UPI0039766E3B
MEVGADFPPEKRKKVDDDSQMSVRRWEDLPPDIWFKILSSSSSELTKALVLVRCAAISTALRSLICNHSVLWATLDFSVMEVEPVYDSPSVLSGVSKALLSLDQGNVTTLVSSPYLGDDAFITYAAKRCLKLKRLVLPSCFTISDTGIYEAFRCWKDLVSLTISPDNTNFPYLLEQISSNCKNFSELKLMGTCDRGFASTLVAYLPKLKVLSLRCTKFTSSDLHIILNDLKQLQVLNISHCFWVQINWIILDKASRLQSFITCMQFDRCIVCRVCHQRDKEDRWHEDEVDSLALNR